MNVLHDIAGSSRQVAGVLLLQLTNWRWSWPQMLLTGLLVPGMSLFGISYLMQIAGSENSLIYAISGSITMALAFESQNKVSANYAYLKATGALDFYSSLPIRKWQFVLATTMAFMLFALPSLILILVVSHFVLGASVIIGLQSLIVAILCISPFVSVGAVIGNLSVSPEQASSVSLAVTLMTSAIGPVAIAPDLLPEWFNRIGVLNPGVYVSDLVRVGFLGKTSPHLLLSIAVIVVLAAAANFVVIRVMRWGRS